MLKIIRPSNMMTLRAAEELKRQLPGLRYLDVTIHNDSEPMVIVTTPRCEYCGSYSPEARCPKCGASSVREGR